MKTRLRLISAFVPFILIFAQSAAAQTQGAATHLSVYDAGVAEFLEERTVELQPGVNQIEWRSLMPKAFIRTVRVTAEDAEVVRQDLTYDGAEVRSQRSPVLHIVLQNRGASGPRRVQVDYLAPDLSWQNDYSIVLDAAGEGEPPASAALDSWVTLNNNTGADLRAGTVDLIAGEVALLTADGATLDRAELGANAMQRDDERREVVAVVPASADASGLSVFSRFRLGREVALDSNVPQSRLPLFQHQRLAVTQRNVFENEYNTQTLARGGFVLLPRGLEVRLVSKNPTENSMPAGQVTIYARDGGLAQIVGQDRVPLTPPGGEFSVTQGRSSTVFGTRRILERRQVEYKNQDGDTREKLVTKIEVVISNRSSRAAEAFVREGVEPFAENQWTILESSHPTEKLAADNFQMKVQVPAGGKTVVTYTVETK
ncbi:MAG TPA: hypothetical protein VFA21_17090 [Pyrinomonadaceae bacterium]|nr:hypothetical protein [Pyrinomonadaceae bacterium]